MDIGLTPNSWASCLNSVVDNLGCSYINHLTVVILTTVFPDIEIRIINHYMSPCRTATDGVSNCHNFVSTKKIIRVLGT